jgi:branched-chain amino acid transport system ATP-binding protein
MTPILACVGLVRTFGALRAVDGVTLALPVGARHALIGPNGAGKSTLFQLLAGGLHPTAGRVWLDGRDVTRMADARRARLGIGQTFQHARLFLSMTAADNVAVAAQRVLGRAWSPVPRRRPALDDRVDQLLARVGLLERRGGPVAALSHGECRQLELALALATAPRVLLLDEPAAGLSPAERVDIQALLTSLPAELTLVMIEHDIDVLRGVVDSAAVLHLGSLVVQGSMRDIQNDERVRELYLGGAGARAPAILALEDSPPPGTSPPEEAGPPREAGPPPGPASAGAGDGP